MNRTYFKAAGSAVGIVALIAVTMILIGKSESSNNAHKDVVPAPTTVPYASQTTIDVPGEKVTLTVPGEKVTSVATTVVPGANVISTKTQTINSTSTVSATATVTATVPAPAPVTVTATKTVTKSLLHQLCNPPGATTSDTDGTSITCKQEFPNHTSNWYPSNDGQPIFCPYTGTAGVIDPEYPTCKFIAP